MSDLKKLDNDAIESIVKSAVDEAIDFIEGEIAPDRIKAQDYYNGEVYIGHEEGRSSVVATKVRDTIRAIRPSLMRIFLSNEKYAEYIPKSPDQVAQAELATKYVHNKFTEVNGYKVLSSAFQDALLKKVGIVKVYWDEYTSSETYELTNVTEQELQLIAQDKDVEIIEKETTMVATLNEFGIEIEQPIHELKLMKFNTEGKLCVDLVPPEEFFVDASAKSIEDCYVCGHSTEMRVADLIALGFDFDDVSDLSSDNASDSMSDEEKWSRNGYQDYRDDENELDPSMKQVLVTEAYMKIDVDGTGVPQLHKIILGGTNYQLLDYEPCDVIPFAVFESDPEPHTFFGKSVADLIIDDQDAATAMLRGVLDNIAMTNMPRLGMVDGQVNVDDLLNNEIGGVVRMRQMGAIQDLSIPFTAGQTLGALEYYDQIIEQKTGVSRMSNGLDPDALQNTTATAVQLTSSAAAAQIEVIARNLAEGGVKQLFRLMLRILVKNTPDVELMKIGGANFVPIDPRAWDTSMQISVNVGLGTGQEDQKLMILQQTLQTQMQIYQNYGAQNGIVSLTNIRNTLADLMAIGGYRNSDRYYAPMNPQLEQQMLAQQAQAQQVTAQQQAEAQQAQLMAQIAALQSQAEDFKARAMKNQTEASLAQFEAETDRIKAVSTNLDKGEADDREFQRRFKTAELLLREKELEIKKAERQKSKEAKNDVINRFNG
jgi:hypothetical protein